MIHPEIPYYVTTVIPENIDLLDWRYSSWPTDRFYLTFKKTRLLDKRKRESLLKRTLTENQLRSEKGLISVNLRNSGFKLSLKNRSIVIDHPDLPEHVSFDFIKSYPYHYQTLGLIEDSKNLINNKLQGSFYYDPWHEGFNLEKADSDEFKVRSEIGYVLTKKKEKLKEGENYIIEIPSPSKVTYIGECNFLVDGYNITNTMVILNGNYPFCSTGCRRLHGYLFYDYIENNYFVTNRKNIRGVNLGKSSHKPLKGHDLEVFAKTRNFWNIIEDKDYLVNFIKSGLKEQIKSEGKIYRIGGISTFTIGVTKPDVIESILRKSISMYSTPAFNMFQLLYDETVPGGLSTEERIDIISEL